MLSQPTPTQVDEIERLFRASRFTDAQSLLEQYSEPEQWDSTRARVIAHRVLGNVGATHRGRRLILATWRRDLSDPSARYFVVLDYCERHGPIETLRLLDDLGQADAQLANPGQIADPHVASLWLLRARCLSLCRDFDAAEEWLAAGERAQPNVAWTFVERATCLEQADRYTEALQAAEHAVALRPGYARAVWQLAHTLVLLRRDDDALELLQRETTAGQSGHLALQLGSLLSESGKLSEALSAFELGERRFPQAEKLLSQFIRSRRADLLHRLGRDDEAAALARDLRGRYWENYAARLSGSGSGARIQLPIPFVRQHHVTCAPATLAAVSVYLGDPIDHEDLARAITYDGTPDHEERHWLETHGWAVREFRVTWETAVALVSNGLPFTLVTSWTGSAHLQAVIGCDERLGTLIIRDPYQRESHEVLAAELLEQQEAYGPRGMVFVRASDAARIRDLSLPDADAYDHWYRLRRHLVAHDRPAAAAAAEHIGRSAPGSRLALWAERQLAYYDDNPARALAAVTALRLKYPKDANLQLEQISLLTRVGQLAEHREQVAAAMRSGKADTAIWREQIEIWRADARQHDRALRLAKRFVRARPYDWIARTTLANVLWDRGDFERAVKLYRFAATGGDKSEAAWRSYFAAARHVGQAAASLALLESRQRRLGDRSSDPAITLTRALDQLDRTSEIPRVLEAAISSRPQDGGLLIELALVLGRGGRKEEAGTHLTSARPKVAPVIWHRAAAQLAAWRGDHADALRHNEALLGENPLDAALLAEGARLRAITGGPISALTWLTECVDRHPHFLPLRQLKLEWLRDRPVTEALAEVREFLKIEPTHAWALREQALILLRFGRASEALDSARLAEEVEPRVPQSPGIVGQVLLAQREYKEAREATERALKIDVGVTWLMPQLVSACPSFSERADAVEYIRGELERQPAPVTGYLRFREVATGVLPPEKLCEALESLRVSQVERWEPWSACIQQAIAMTQTDVAVRTAQQAAEKFPLVPRAWLDLADAYRLAGAIDKEEAALIRTREISPAWPDAALRLATLYQRILRLADGERVLQAALAHDPLDARMRLSLAESFWRSGRCDEAMTAAEQAIESNPAWGAAWSEFGDWCAEKGEPKRVVEFARRVAERRPGDVHARRQVATLLTRSGDHASALEEANAAALLNPLDADSHDLRAFLLSQLGRRDDALAACSPEPFKEYPIHRLQGRAAWVRWQFGERRAAIELMTSVTSAHPDYAWGWQQLAEWHGVVDENERAAVAAQKLAELCPDDPTAWGWVALFKIKASRELEALPILERALQLDPGYRYAALQLLKLASQHSRRPEAERALTLIRQHASKWHALRCSVLYHRYCHEKNAAFAALRELTLAPTTETSELLEAAEDIAAANWLGEVETLLREMLPRSDLNPQAGAIWMRARLSGPTFARRRIRWLECEGVADATRYAGWRVYLEWLAERRSTLLVRWHIARRGQWLMRDDETWGTVSYVLTNLQRYRRLVSWMADWPTRRNVQPWMLSNLVHSLIALDRWPATVDVVSAALRLPADQTRGAFVSWAAHIAAQDGRYHDAERFLALFENAKRDPFAALFAEQARAILDVANADPKLRSAKFAEARSRIEQALCSWPSVANVSYIIRENRRALRTAARLAGSRWQWWYAVPSLRARLPAMGLATGGMVAVVILLIAVIAAGAPTGAVLIALLFARLFSAGTQRR